MIKNKKSKKVKKVKKCPRNRKCPTCIQYIEGFLKQGQKMTFVTFFDLCRFNALIFWI